MLRKILPAFFLLLMFYIKSQSQACTTLGQNPSTAFPVCGLDTFRQSSVPACGGKTIPVPGCNDINYADLNPYWYKFTCYQTGTFGFLITPEDLGDDYDWQIFDITGHSPDEVYTNTTLFVTGNWSGSYGATGTLPNNTNIISCASNPADNITTFSNLPVITQGHTYLLLISHFSGNNQSGYNLTFGGGTASIVDPVKPALVSASANCSGETIFVALNKKLKCTSLAADGSDFTISPAVARVISAGGVNCNAAFDLDSVSITIDKPLPPGDYSVIIKNGKDNNTLLDDCNNNVLPNSSIPFTIYPLVPTPMDSLTPLNCAPDVISLVFRKGIRCSSIAVNGSDFIVTGNLPVSVISASGDSCANGLSSIVKVKVNKPIQISGTWSITLKKGTDGNTILDECAQETPAGSALNFTTADTVSANFSYGVDLGCVYDTLVYAHDGRNGVNEWNWAFDSDGVSAARDSIFLFDDYGTKHIKLNCSNGVCSDSAAADILLDNELISRFQVSPSPLLCPEDGAQYIDSSTGKIVGWYWIFGDGKASTLQVPPMKYYARPPTQNGSIFPAALIVQNDIGCFDTSRQTIKVFYNCYIAVPGAFTPNGDGLNDYLYPLNAYKADNLEFRVYNRWGQLVFETKDWTKKWDGRINGNPQAAGTYVWMLQYTHHDTVQFFSLKGTTVLIR